MVHAITPKEVSVWPTRTQRKIHETPALQLYATSPDSHQPTASTEHKKKHYFLCSFVFFLLAVFAAALPIYPYLAAYVCTSEKSRDKTRVSVAFGAKTEQ